MTTKYKMLSEEDKANFRAWMDCSDCDPRFMNARVGDRIEHHDDLMGEDRTIEVVEDDDDDEMPKPCIPAASRGNGNGYAFP
jgi:hypothetical protein